MRMKEVGRRLVAVLLVSCLADQSLQASRVMREERYGGFGGGAAKRTGCVVLQDLEAAWNNVSCAVQTSALPLAPKRPEKKSSADTSIAQRHKRGNSSNPSRVGEGGYVCLLLPVGDERRCEQKHRGHENGVGHQGKAAGKREEGGEGVGHSELCTRLSTCVWQGGISCEQVVSIIQGEWNMPSRLSPVSINTLRWDDQFASLCKFKDVFGHCRVSDALPQSSLAHWIVRQRVAYNAKQLSSERVSKLESLGFGWDVRSDKWEQCFALLVFFRQTHGHCNVPKKFASEPKLGHWVSLQRERMKEGKFVDVKRATQLEDIGLSWDCFESEWNRLFCEMKAFIAKTGNGIIPAVAVKGLDKSVCHWASLQRLMYRKGTLSEKREKLLRQAGFEMSHVCDRWDDRLKRVLCSVREGGKEWWKTVKDGEMLRAWIVRQRSQANKGQLGQDRSERLSKEGLLGELDLGYRMRARKKRALVVDAPKKMKARGVSGDVRQSLV